MSNVMQAPSTLAGGYQSGAGSHRPGICTFYFETGMIIIIIITIIIFFGKGAGEIQNHFI